MNKALRKQAIYFSSGSWISLCSSRLEGGKVPFRNSLQHLNTLCRPRAAVFRVYTLMVHNPHGSPLSVWSEGLSAGSFFLVSVTPGTKKIFVCSAETQTCLYVLQGQFAQVNVTIQVFWVTLGEPREAGEDFLRIPNDLSFDPAICTSQWNLCAHVEAH